MAGVAYFVFGPQGSGKSTQGRWLAEKLNLPFFDTGHELREIASENTALAKEIKTQMAAGQLVSHRHFEIIISNFIASHEVARGLIVDGFPRTLPECELVATLQKRYGWKITALLIDISDQTARERIAKRAKIEGRADDQPEILTKRLQEYRDETLPVIDYFKKHYQVMNFDGEKTIDEVTFDVAKKLNLTL